MYLEHFGLAQYPFSLTPNTRYFLKLPSHLRIFEAVVASLSQPGQFCKIVGEVGTGKTMLCRKMLNALEFHKDKFATAFIPHPILSEEALLSALADELGLEDYSGKKYRELLKDITSETLRLASTGRQLVLFIDEAQAMPEESLNAIYLLTQAQSGSKLPMQVILFGQPELDELLNRPVLRQLSNEIENAFTLPALSAEGVEAYVQHRLAKAGYSGNHMFTNSALKLLVESSCGVPRLINVLCHKALLVAYGKGERVVDEIHIRRAAEDTESLQKKKSWSDRFFT